MALDWVPIAAMAGALVGLKDGLTGAALTAGLGLFVGAGLGFTELVARRVSATRGLLAWLERATDRRGADRSAVIRFCAGYLALLVVLAVSAPIVGFAQRRLWLLPDVRLGVTLSGIAVLCLGVLAFLGGHALAAGLRPALAWVDKTVRLPLPPTRAGMALVFVAAPIGAVTTAVVVRFDAPHGTDVLVAVIGILTAGVLRLAWPQSLPWPIRFSPAALAVVGLSLVSPEQEGEASRMALATLWALTDFDGDGASGLFGGPDCDGFDETINPRAFDVALDGIDQDCDGADAEYAARLDAGALVEPRFSGVLPAERVLHYNIVLVIIDAVRADHTSLLGYPKPTTPYLERLAKESLVFTEAYSQSSATVFSFSSIFTGRNPGGLQWHIDRNRPQPVPATLTLAERLRDAGYSTAIATNTYMLGRYPGMLDGFDRIADIWLDEDRHRWTSRSSPVAMTLGIRLIEAAKAPFFVTIYLEDPHNPYTPHPEGYPDFGDGATAGYDGEIAFADRHLGFLLEYLEHRPEVWARTILVATSDHGEEFGEHGGRFHARTCYEESTHVPLVVRVPLLEPAVLETPVGLVDLVPMLIELTGLAPGDAPLDGQSLLIPALTPSRGRPDRPIFCSVASQKDAHGSFLRRSVRSGHRVLHHDMLAGTYELYDVAEDRAEKFDLYPVAAADPSVGELKQWLKASHSGNLAEHDLLPTPTAASR